MLAVTMVVVNLIVNMFGNLCITTLTIGRQGPQGSMEAPTVGHQNRFDNRCLITSTIGHQNGMKAPTIGRQSRDDLTGDARTILRPQSGH